MRTGRDIAIIRPIAIAGTTPMTKPAAARNTVAAVCASSSPFSASCQKRTAMSLGAGMKRRSPKPSRNSTSHTIRSATGEIR